MSLPSAGRIVALTGAVVLFMWMFLAVAPIETIADTGGLAGADTARAADEAYRFAAAWRHGMAGNSPLYMPGFFVLAIATWLWSGPRPRPVPQLVVEGTMALAVGLMVAWAIAPAARRAIIQAFEQSSGLAVVAPWPEAPGRAVAQGLYTAIAWMTSVVAGQQSLARRSWRPLWSIPPAAIVLALIRPWTVDEFTSAWARQAGRGDWTALVSAAAVPVVAWGLVRSEHLAQQVHTLLRARRIQIDR